MINNTDIARSTMECSNKDEALRAKRIAENKLLERDITGAKKFALKAQRLYPKLEGLHQFLVMIDVYVAHEKKINGESDYYNILGVDRLADEQALKKQYKNKLVKAGDAFKIMSQAWNVLSDKNKRNAYNLKVNNIKASNQPQTKPTWCTAIRSQTPTHDNAPCIALGFLFLAFLSVSLIRLAK